MFDKVRNAVADRVFNYGYEPVRMDAEACQQLHDVMDETPSMVFIPHKNGEGVANGPDLADSLYDLELGETGWKNWRQNESPVYSYEIWFDEGEVEFHLVPPSETARSNVKKQVKDKYPQARIDRSSKYFPTVEVGDYVAGGTVTLRKEFWMPIKCPEKGVETFETDPYGPITSAMVVGSEQLDDGTVVRNRDCRMLIQVAFQAASKDWSRRRPFGVDCEKAGTEMKNGKLTESTLKEIQGEVEQEDPSRKWKQAGEQVASQRGQPGFHVRIRVIGISPYEEVAQKHVSEVCDRLEEYYNAVTEQGLVSQPERGSDLRELLWKTAARDLEHSWSYKPPFHDKLRQDKDILSAPELGGLMHLPNDEINTQEVLFANSKMGTGVPPKTPRFDFREAGVASASDEEKQVAMLETADRGEPIWYGWGAKSHVEAGVRAETLNTHQFVGGATGEGKTTLLKNYAHQIMNRGHGAMIYDPKGMDTEDFVSLVPEGREDDLIFVDVGGEQDHQVGFNFLEPPTDAGPESQVYVDAVESMTDDIAALLTEAGGEEDYWGPRMDQITRNMTRGMAMAGFDCTLLDMYLALLDEDGRMEYADMVSGDRLDWISSYASRELTDMEQSDVRPVLGRLKELVENPTTRELISHPESTTSIRDAVRNGRIIIVRDRSSQDNAGRLVATALIRRIWVAIREQTLSDDQDDPPEFYAILDEFNDIASANSDITQILANARSFGLSITAACQDLSAQLDGDILKAIEGQCKTFLSFNPGRKGDAKLIADQHSRNVDYHDLLNTSKYTFWMRTHDNRDELTDSFKVKGFPPVDEIDSVGRSKAEAERLMQESLEHYGAPRRSDEEIRADSVFGSGTPATQSASTSGEVKEAVSETAAEPAGESSDGVDIQHADEILECVFAVRAQRRDDPGAWVPTREVEDLVEERLGSTGYLSQIGNVLEQLCTATEYAEQDQVEGEPAIRLTAQGRAQVFAQDTGTSASGGGKMHRIVLEKCYEAFWTLGFYTRIPRQEGEELPDGVAELPIDPMDADTYAEVEARREELQEKYPAVWELSEGRSVAIEAETTTIEKPKQTLTNLRKAVNQGRLCVFASKDATNDDSTPDYADLGYWPKRGEKIIYDTYRDGRQTAIDYDTLTFASSTDEKGNRRFYNKASYFEIEDGVKALRPATDANVVWEEDGDEILLRDEGGPVHARFDGPEDLDDPAANAFPAYYERDQSAGEYIVHENGETTVYESVNELEEDWDRVYSPFMPELEFDEMPTEDDFMFVAFPDRDNPEFDEPQIVEEGEFTPLLPDDEDHEIAARQTDADASEDGSVSDVEERTGGENPTVCPECGAAGADNWTESDEGVASGVVCSDCGYMPRNAVEDKIRAAKDSESPADPGPTSDEGQSETDTTSAGDETRQRDGREDNPERPDVDCCPDPTLAPRYTNEDETQTGWVCVGCFTPFSLDGEPQPMQDEDGKATDDESTNRDRRSKQTEHPSEVDDALEQWQ